MTSYAARDRVYVVVEERVSTRLLAFPEAAAQRIAYALQAEGENVAKAARAAVGAHGRGKLAASVKVKTKTYRDVAVWTSISMGGTRATRHGHLYERGFSGTETVPAHDSRSRFGKVFTVKDYRRTVSYVPHLSLEHSLDGRRAAIRARVLSATGEAAEIVGLG